MPVENHLLISPTATEPRESQPGSSQINTNAGCAIGKLLCIADMTGGISGSPGLASSFSFTIPLQQRTAVIMVTHDNKIFDRLDLIFSSRDGRIEVPSLSEEEQLSSVSSIGV